MSCRAAALVEAGGPTGGKMAAAIGSHDWRDRKVREWLLLLLRFAVTRELSDQSAALTSADELDSLGVRWRPTGPIFFSGRVTRSARRYSRSAMSTAIVSSDGTSRASTTFD
jgi:hypothetical protein